MVRHRHISLVREGKAVFRVVGDCGLGDSAIGTKPLNNNTQKKPDLRLGS